MSIHQSGKTNINVIGNNNSVLGDNFLTGYIALRRYRVTWRTASGKIQQVLTMEGVSVSDVAARAERTTSLADLSGIPVMVRVSTIEEILSGDK